MWELLTGEEPYADLHYGAIIGKYRFRFFAPSFQETAFLVIINSIEIQAG